MIIKDGKKGTVTFVYNGKPNDKKVCLAGDFNDWNGAARRMIKSKDGSFRAKLSLPPGEYEYKFVVDGTWISDPDAAAHKPNPFGSSNSLVIV